MSESSTVSSSSSAFNSSTRVNANMSRRKSSASSSFKASEIIENILNDACAHIDDRKRNPEDFKLSARHIYARIIVRLKLSKKNATRLIYVILNARTSISINRFIRQNKN